MRSPFHRITCLTLLALLSVINGTCTNWVCTSDNEQQVQGSAMLQTSFLKTTAFPHVPHHPSSLMAVDTELAKSGDIFEMPEFAPYYKFPNGSCDSCEPAHQYVQYTYSTNCSNPTSDGDRAVDGLLISAAPQEKPVSIACAIWTYRGAHEAALDSFMTWGKSCDVFLAFSDEEWSDDDNRIRTIPLRGENISELSGAWETIQRVWKYLADQLEEGSLNFDYVTISGDDAFFILPNLRSYLSTLPESSEANSLDTDLPRDFTSGFEFIGLSARRHAGLRPYMDGAGYVLNKALVASRLLSKCDPKVLEMHHSAEDLFTSHCLQFAGVPLREARDPGGNGLFCAHPPGNACNRYTEEVVSSESAVLFHYTKGTTRTTLFERLRACKDFSLEDKAE